MRSSLFILLCFLTYSFSIQSQTHAEKQIRDILARQVKAWNNGDLDGFMNGYWQNDSLMYIGKSGVTYGYGSTLATYKKNYGDTSRMGKLTFTILHVKRLSPKYYHVLGKWSLKRAAGDVSGYYTLLFRKIRGEWVIVSDHSS